VGWWERCCDNTGQISTCYCDGNSSCNYGWFETCPDFSCTYAFDCNPDAGPPDLGPRDAGLPDASPPDATVVDAGPPVGEWEPCCNDGTISSCICEGGGECNYGWFTPCTEGACGFDTCMLPNPGDYAVVCCRDGRLTSCVCVAGEPCEANAGGFRTCQSGVCVAPDAPCP
jgi:hypothetical protein